MIASRHPAQAQALPCEGASAPGYCSDIHALIHASTRSTICHTYLLVRFGIRCSDSAPNIVFMDTICSALCLILFVFSQHCAVCIHSCVTFANVVLTGQTLSSSVSCCTADLLSRCSGSSACVTCQPIVSIWYTRSTKQPYLGCGKVH